MVTPKGNNVQWMSRSEFFGESHRLFALCLNKFKLQDIGKISDAILTDQRAFRVNGPEWVETYNKLEQ